MKLAIAIIQRTRKPHILIIQPKPTSGINCSTMIRKTTSPVDKPAAPTPGSSPVCVVSTSTHHKRGKQRLLSDTVARFRQNHIDITLKAQGKSAHLRQQPSRNLEPRRADNTRCRNPPSRCQRHEKYPTGPHFSCRSPRTRKNRSRQPETNVTKIFCFVLKTRHPRYRRRSNSRLADGCLVVHSSARLSRPREK